MNRKGRRYAGYLSNYIVKPIFFPEFAQRWGIGIKKLASYSHRAATTAHPCYIPVLGDSAGAGRIRLARGAKVCKKRSVCTDHRRF